MRYYIYNIFIILVLSFTGNFSSAQTISGELRKWHKVTFTFSSGIQTNETATSNPFTDYRLIVTFTKGGKTYKIPGHYAADGNAANTSAVSGDKWRVHFSPDETGTWHYEVSFKTGSYISINDDESAGTPIAALHG